MLTSDSCAQCGSPAATAALPGSPCRCVLRHAAIATAPRPSAPTAGAVASASAGSEFGPMAPPPPPPPPAAGTLLVTAIARTPDAQARPPATAMQFLPVRNPPAPVDGLRAFDEPLPAAAAVRLSRQEAPPAVDVPAAATDNDAAAAVERPSAVETGRGWSVRQGRDAPRLDWDVLQPPLPPMQVGDPAGPTFAPSSLAPVQRKRTLALRAGVISSIALLAGVAALDAVAGGGLSGLFGSGRSLSQPSSIGSMALVDTPAAQVATDLMRSGLSPDAKQTVVGVYGSTGAPQLIFVAAKGGTPETSQQIVGDLTNAGLGFDGSGTIIPTLGGQQFECGVLSGQAFGAATLCAWNENDIDAVVLNLGSSDLQATATLAAQARAAAVH